MIEMPRQEATVTKYVILVPRDGKLKYVGRWYKPKDDSGYTIKLNGAMIFDTEDNARKTMEWFGLKGSIGRIEKHTELMEIL